MKHKFFYKFQQLKRYVKQLNKLIKTGRFKTLSAKKRKQIINRIERLQKQLAFASGKKQVKRLLVAASLALGLALPASAQYFVAPQVNPFGIQSPYAYSFATSKDLDDDGDYDVLIGGYGNFEYYQNTGTATAPAFAAPTTNPFGLVDTSIYITAFPELADVDGDGDYDLFFNTVYNPAIQYCENTGTKSAPVFSAPINNPFGITPSASGYSIPAFADMDDDGDLDLMIGGYYGAISYLENTGTATAPAFGTPVSDPFGLTGVPYTFLSLPKLADIDGDGDYDLAYGYGGYGTYVHMNTGTKTAPVFGVGTIDPFGLAGMTNYLNLASPLFIDIDGDGDLDALQGGYLYPSGFLYQENNASPISGDTSITTIKNTDYTFALGDFPFTDDSPSPTSVVVESLPFNGQLRLSGAPVSSGDTIMAADVGNFTFTPWPDSIGTPYTTLEFSVRDDYSSSGIHVLTINVEAPVGVAKLIDNATLTLAPNPATDYLRIEITGIEPQKPASLSVLDVSGRLVHREIVEPSELYNKTISTSDLANGVYFMVIETELGVMRERFVKK